MYNKLLLQNTGYGSLTLMGADAQNARPMKKQRESKYPTHNTRDTRHTDYTEKRACGCVWPVWPWSGIHTNSLALLLGSALCGWAGSAGNMSGERETEIEANRNGDRDKEKRRDRERRTNDIWTDGSGSSESQGAQGVWGSPQ